MECKVHLFKKTNIRIRIKDLSGGAIALFLITSILGLRISGIIATVVVTLFFALIEHERYVLITELSILGRDLL